MRAEGQLPTTEPECYREEHNIDGTRKPTLIKFTALRYLLDLVLKVNPKTLSAIPGIFVALSIPTHLQIVNNEDP